MSGPPVAPSSPRAGLRDYYSDSEYFVSAEGILKVLSVVAGMASSAVLVGGGACAGAPWQLAGGAAVALVAVAATACLYAGVALSLAARAPLGWFYTDVIVSTSAGVLVLLAAALAQAACRATAALVAARAALGVAHAGLLLSGAGCTYVAAMRRLDAARTTAAAADDTPQPTELDV